MPNPWSARAHVLKPKGQRGWIDGVVLTVAALVAFLVGGAALGTSSRRAGRRCSTGSRHVRDAREQGLQRDDGILRRGSVPL